MTNDTKGYKIVRDRDASFTHAGRQTVYGSPSFLMFNMALKMSCGLPVAEVNMLENRFHLNQTTFKQNIDKYIRHVASKCREGH
ncbi:hypothetical protein GHT06_017923 [Daphnia sinensis]|uniref:Uncharacterized protein n=1 Tax=Daphnia sinensis TaxID=1820382 RepID=A0AAD5PQG3_9CRUS|nr:hypothetical protein GHT06_017923 [Daphnia sinensis]